MLRNNPTTDKVYVGIDEAGRGCLAGPVVAAAVIWNPEYNYENPDFGQIIMQIKDSKKLSQKKRYELAEFIRNHSVDYAIAVVDNTVIDNINILQATHKAMHEACSRLRVDFDNILVDGNSFPIYKNKQHTCVIRGDDTYICIAAASILAKTTRDDMMKDIANIHPEYKWQKNYGYGTSEHINAIKEHGVTKYHRVSFYPCSVLVNEDDETNIFE